MTIQVTLSDHTTDPIRSLYLAYRTCYSSITPQEIFQRIDDERITQEAMFKFVEDRLKTGHGSPLEQVWFEFLISGVSRTFSHQFVRHRTGISFEQQSQRYVVFKNNSPTYVIPETIRKAGMEQRVLDYFSKGNELYINLLDAGVHGEDARFVLPNATSTNFKIVVNFAELLHICDLRLCTRAQWEFRKVAAMMRGEINKKFPELGKYLQPKCGEHRMGYCDESIADWEACPLGKKRPHKSQILAMFSQNKPLNDTDMEETS